MQIPTLDGRTLQVAIKDVVHPTYSKAKPCALAQTRSSTLACGGKVVPNEGMPSSKQAGVKGNLVLTFDVEYPKQLSQAQKDAVQANLPRA